MEKSRVVKRSLVVNRHKTSVTLEAAFWNRLREIADENHMTLSALVGQIDADRQFANLSSAIRLFVLEAYRKQISELAGTSSVGTRRNVQSPARHGSARLLSRAAPRNRHPR